ncbi:serine/threonine-protein kinase [Actinomadura opuntiae]|uniref:serine/threonine-protein kinase n=1 Tax=Actinomadura sp. OS1-43 TaxID=604315 RepID=UPI00255B2F55|nr:serine/threonine-protein kinase [Actinomadura sp. OS1-43]MDL4816783.1 serine/threonine-protein kinase [Actinomadura sp. OS1-43]
MADRRGSLLAGRYRLFELLGQGPMGGTWRAHDEQSNRQVAVKEVRFPDDLDTARRAEWVALLDRDLQAVARLRHPGIVAVHDRIVDGDGHPWIVMELIHGRSLDDLVRTEGPLAPQRVADIGVQLLATLRAAHQAGITHRDIKPANVLLEGDRVVLAGFGLAAGEANPAGSNALPRALGFSSPEQARGLPATAQSDLWSLGATLYTAVEGHPPFSGASSGAVLIAVAADEPAPAVHAGPLAPALAGLLRKNPAERLTADQLEALLTRPPVPAQHGAIPPHPAPPGQYAPPTPQPFAPGGPPRRRPAVLIAVLVAAALAVVIAVTVTVLLMTQRTDPAYENNRRAAKELGAPAGFDLKSERNAGDGVLHETLVKSCPGRCTEQQVREETVATANWLKTKPGVLAVVPVPSQDGLTGSISVRTNGRAPIANVQITLSRSGQVLLQLDVG